MSRVAIYLRQSEDKTGEADAVQRQEEACRLLVQAKGWEVAELYRDNSISATSGKARPAFEKLVADVHAGQLDGIVVWHLDRLTRSMKDLTRVIEAGQAKRVNIACVHGVSLDLGDPTGVAVASILTAIAAMEVAHKGQRQRAANRQRAVKGKAFWTRRPFGYDRNDDGVFIVEPEAKLIRSGADDVLAGATLASVARTWNEQGFTTTASSAGQWGVTQVRRTLINPRYAGKRLYNGEDMGDGDWEPILDPERHKALEHKLTDPRRRTAPDDLAARYLLSGIAECGKCGRKMFASAMKGRGKQWMVYRCFGGYCMTRRLDLVEGVVEDIIKVWLTRPDAIGMTVQPEEFKSMGRELSDLRARRDSLAALLADGLLELGAVREQSGKLSKRIAALESSLASASAADPIAALIGAPDVAKAWSVQDLADKRRFIRNMMRITILPAGKGIRFSEDQVKVDWIP